jgi:uncharacterized coiled-coil protein SlyX
MSNLEDLEQRVAALEERQSMEAALRAAGDLDLAGVVARVRAQTRLIQALGTTQSEHTAMLRSLDAKVTDHGEKLDRIIGLLDHLTGGNGGPESG